MALERDFLVGGLKAAGSGVGMVVKKVFNCAATWVGSEISKPSLERSDIELVGRLVFPSRLPTSLKKDEVLFESFVA